MIGPQLKAAREKAGLTQHELGVAAGYAESLAQSRVAAYEAGTREPSLAEISQFASVLKVTPQELAFGVPLAGPQRSDVETLHIHLYGAPGVGKSTLASTVHNALKIAGVGAEMPPEHAKELAWQRLLGKVPQFMISSEQYKREFELRRYVPVLVCESPPLLGVAYAPESYREPLRQTLAALQEGWHTMPYLVQREFTNGYEEQGRRETMAESREKALIIEQTLAASGVNATRLVAKDDVEEVYRLASIVVRDVMEVLQRPRQHALPAHRIRSLAA